MRGLRGRDLDRIVVDTNVFVSAIALSRSVPRQAVNRMLDSGVLCSPSDDD